MDTTGTGPLTGPDGLARTPWAAADELLRDYYDTEWGLPVYSEAELYERLVLEGFQAGLSWRLILSLRRLRSGRGGGLRDRRRRAPG